MKIVHRPIGVVRSPFSEAEGMPIQPSRARGIRGTVELAPEYAEGLQDLDGFSHAVLLCHLHRSRGFSLKVVPFLDHVARGVFATRAPQRPNPIGRARESAAHCCASSRIGHACSAAARCG